MLQINPLWASSVGVKKFTYSHADDRSKCPGPASLRILLKLSLPYLESWKIYINEYKQASYLSNGSWVSPSESEKKNPHIFKFQLFYTKTITSILSILFLTKWLLGDFMWLE